MNAQPSNTADAAEGPDAVTTGSLAADAAALTQRMEAVRAEAVRYMNELPERPVLPSAAAPPPTALPERGDGMQAALSEFERVWLPLFGASAGPRYFGFVTGGATPAAVAGDWLAGAVDHNAASMMEPAGHDLEHQTVDWLRQLLGLPPGLSGAFVSGATMSNTTGLAVAREWLAERRGVRASDDGVAAIGDVAVLSATPHSSIAKALSMLGLGRRALRTVPRLAGREAVDVAALEQALAEHGGPCVVVANLGTVNTGDFDDLAAVAELRRRHDFWLHVDGAFGAFAALAPERAGLLAGVEHADSVCVDLHKWLNVPYDSAVLFTRHPELQARVFANNAAYLTMGGAGADFMHLTPENSRRLRALPAWFTLRAYGAEGHREIVRRCLAQARLLAGEITQIPALRLLAPARSNVVCFTLRSRPTADRLAGLARAVASEVFFSPTELEGVPALRGALCNWRTGRSDIDRAAAALRRHAPG